MRKLYNLYSKDQANYNYINLNQTVDSRRRSFGFAFKHRVFPRSEILTYTTSSFICCMLLIEISRVYTVKFDVGNFIGSDFIDCNYTSN